MEELSRNKIDISLFPETTLDETFPSQQFKISDIEMSRRDRTKHEREIIFYISKNITCNTEKVTGLPDN